MDKTLSNVRLEEDSKTSLWKKSVMETTRRVVMWEVPDRYLLLRAPPLMDLASPDTESVFTHEGERVGFPPLIIALDQGNAVIKPSIQGKFNARAVVEPVCSQSFTRIPRQGCVDYAIPEAESP